MRIWTWARRRRGTWTAAEAATATAVSPRRARAIIAAMADAGIVHHVSARDSRDEFARWQPAEWHLTDAGRRLLVPPIMIVDRSAGLITGVRVCQGEGNAMLRDVVEASGLSLGAAAKIMGIRVSTLQGMLSDRIRIGDEDPALVRLRASKQKKKR